MNDDSTNIKPETKTPEELNTAEQPNIELPADQPTAPPVPQADNPSLEKSQSSPISSPRRPSLPRLRRFKAKNTEQVNPEASSTDTPKPRSRKKLIILISLLIMLLVIVGAAYYLLVIKGQSETPQTSTNTSSPDETEALPASEDIIVNGNTYFAAPKELKDLTLFKSDACENNDKDCENGKSPTSKAYQVGITKDNQDIIVYRKEASIDSIDLLFVKNKDKYEIVMPKNVDKYYIADPISDNVVSKSSVELKELKADEEITIEEQSLKQPFSGFSIAFLAVDTSNDDYRLVTKNPEKGTKIFTKGNIEYYKYEKDEGAYTVNSITAYFGNLFQFDYKLAGEVSSAESSAANKIKWSKGDQTSAAYYTGGKGCGSGDTYVVAKVEKNDLTEVGKTPGGQTVYQLKSDHPIVKELYEKDYNKGERIYEEKNKNLTLQQFTDRHGYFLIENGFGEYMVMLSDALIQTGGCAKPVIYLYPTTTTTVNIKVGANVTVSDPLYPADGWKNVLANPAGQLTYNGKNYSSLFWEGKAYGTYPNILAGTIVKQADAISTISNQLRQQGLNPREIKDFIDFWEPNLPDSPYIRLSWLGTADLDQLAPLNVSPKPNTSIRVFLDFEGLNKPINIRPQNFTTPKRIGFTLVEWGGLARNGLGTLVQ